MSDEDVYGLVIRGRALLADGHALEAAKLLQRAKAAEPGKASIRETLARALYNSGQTRRAEEEFAAAVEIDPSNDYAHFGLGLCRAKTGDRSAAVGHLKIAVAMRPDVEAYQDALKRLAG
jgi:tetratricopeptide (TPR) repeat protein